MHVIKEIVQKDKRTLTIHWSDGAMYDYTLEALQRHCPCASCAQQPKVINPSLSAERIFSIGSYALGITFINGCSAGIYDFPLLRQIGEEKA